MNTTPAARIDHLVVGADTLAQGLAWCEAALGITPAAGGQHAWMGTHNRVFAICSAAFPRAYLEIIAIDLDAPAPARARWFGLDAPRVRAALRESPRLLHFVASPADLGGARAALAAIGLDVGVPSAASRATPQGTLRWRITVRDDGLPQLGGAVPTLIEWDSAHPADALPASGVTLLGLDVYAPETQLLRAAYAAIGMKQVALVDDASLAAPQLRARLATPRGALALEGGMP